MTNEARFFVTLLLFLQSLVVSGQTTKANSLADASPAKGIVPSVSLPNWLPFPILPSLYEKWRKYGQWDYKQQGSKYRDFTKFNFGATGNAAGLTQDAVLALANAATPTPNDIETFNVSKLEEIFAENYETFEKLRTMADQDSRVIRISNDFTLLDDDTKWPREKVGFSENRWNEYRAIFKKLALSDGIVRNDDFPDAIFAISQSRGLCTGGSSAGFVYSEKQLLPISQTPLKTLDINAREKPDIHYSYVFKPLKANWYTFYEVDW